jgi:mono/diheme cytochrome c family protein
MNKTITIIGALALSAASSLTTGACTKQGTTTSEEPVGMATGDQAAHGKQLYSQNCAKCHGADGAGTKDAPPVVGANALPLDPPATAKKRTMQFRTGKDVFTFVKQEMPLDKPGSLSDEDVAAILAFDLKANGVDLKGRDVTPASADSIVLH